MKSCNFFTELMSAVPGDLISCFESSRVLSLDGQNIFPNKENG